MRRLDAEIDAEADDAAALTHDAREKQLAEAQGDLLSIERDEAALTWQAQAQGLPAQHRHDCSPLAILQCMIVTVPRTNGSGSSAQHAYDVVQPGGRRRLNADRARLLPSCYTGTHGAQDGATCLRPPLHQNRAACPLRRVGPGIAGAMFGSGRAVFSRLGRSAQPAIRGRYNAPPSRWRGSINARILGSGSR